MKKILFLAVTILLGQGMLQAQTFTMAKKCQESAKQAGDLNYDKKYQEALTAWEAVEKDCKTKDAKELVQNGKARSLNGLERYDEAITAANASLKVTKGKSLNGYYERAAAYHGLGKTAEAQADFNKIIELTEKNQNVKERATLYAKLGESHFYTGDIAQGYADLDKAISLDPANSNFTIQKGDMLAREGKYDEAFAEYDKAVGMGRTDLDMYVLRSNARFRQMEQKYGTNNAQELRNKMSATEKDQLCTELKQALALGLKDMQKDMFSALVCK